MTEIGAVQGSTFAELEVARHESGRLMFPDELRRVNERGELSTTKIRVWVPTPSDQIDARVQARIWFGSKKGLDPERDRDLFDEMEQICLLARAIRTTEPPHGQLCDATELAGYDEACLHDILERINAYKAALDPRPSDLDDEHFWNTVITIARTASLVPLAGIAGRAQRSFITRMAREASRSRTDRSSAPSSESSTPER